MSFLTTIAKRLWIGDETVDLVRPFANASPWNTAVGTTPYTHVPHAELDDDHWWVNLGGYDIPVVNSAPGDPVVAVSVPAKYGRPATIVNVRIPPGITGASDMGSLLVVPPGFTMPSGMSALGQKIWRAAQRYGFIVVDRADIPTLYADPFSMSSADVNPLRVWWCSGCNDLNDLDKIAKQLHVARYP